MLKRYQSDNRYKEWLQLCWHLFAIVGVLVIGEAIGRWIGDFRGFSSIVFVVLGLWYAMAIRYDQITSEDYDSPKRSTADQIESGPDYEWECEELTDDFGPEAVELARRTVKLAISDEYLCQQASFIQPDDLSRVVSQTLERLNAASLEHQIECANLLLSNEEFVDELADIVTTALIEKAD